MLALPGHHVTSPAAKSEMASEAGRRMQATAPCVLHFLAKLNSKVLPSNFKLSCKLLYLPLAQNPHIACTVPVSLIKSMAPSATMHACSSARRAG
jgi:hypothetical protein